MIALKVLFLDGWYWCHNYEIWFLGESNLKKHIFTYFNHHDVWSSHLYLRPITLRNVTSVSRLGFSTRNSKSPCVALCGNYISRHSRSFDCRRKVSVPVLTITGQATLKYKFIPWSCNTVYIFLYSATSKAMNGQQEHYSNTCSFWETES